jgi:hypothetical protein
MYILTHMDQVFSTGYSLGKAIFVEVLHDFLQYLLANSGISQKRPRFLGSMYFPELYLRNEIPIHGYINRSVKVLLNKLKIRETTAYRSVVISLY